MKTKRMHISTVKKDNHRPVRVVNSVKFCGKLQTRITVATLEIIVTIHMQWCSQKFD